MRYLTASVIPEGVNVTLLTCLCRIWVNTPSAWLLFYVCIPESCGQSFKPRPVFMSCCFCVSRPVWYFESLSIQLKSE